MTTPTPPPGYKLVKGEDIKDRVPEGARYFERGLWVKSLMVGDRLRFDFQTEGYYAIPIQTEKPTHPNKAAKVAKPADIPDDACIFAQWLPHFNNWTSIIPSKRSEMVKDFWFAYTDASGVHSDYATAPYDIKTSVMEKPSITAEAESIVAGDRAADYGDVNESFARIAGLWSAYKGVEFTPWDVAQMMILLKVSRAKTSRKRDTLVDIIGYAECASNLKL